MSKVSYGSFTISLGDSEYELRPTLGAFKKVQARFGGLRAALEALTHVNIDHLEAIIAAGAGLDKRARDALAQEIFDEGVTSVTEQVTPFLSALFNPNGASEDGDDGEGK